MAVHWKISLMNEFKMAIVSSEIPVSGWTCSRIGTRGIKTELRSYGMNSKSHTIVDVGGVGLLPGLSPLLLSVRVRRRGSSGGLLYPGLRSGFGRRREPFRQWKMAWLGFLVVEKGRGC